LPSSRRRPPKRTFARLPPPAPRPADGSGAAGGTTEASATTGWAASTGTPQAPSAASRPAGSRPATRPAGGRPNRPVRRGRTPVRGSFLERNRTRVISLVAASTIVLLGVFVYFQATAPAYACGMEWTAPATPSPAPGQSQRIGYAQEDMGRIHVAVGSVVKYLYCPPASGNHYFSPPLGPIPPKVYGVNDHPIPQGWVHNLEHGALVVLYKCPGDACTDAGQAALNQFYSTFPNSPVCNLPAGIVGPVIARFDDMNYPYVALVWDQILPLQTWDPAQVLAFFAQNGERTNPEPQAGCQASPAPGASASPAAS